MHIEKNRVDWARIIANPEMETGGNFDHAGDWNLPRAIGRCFARASRRMSRRIIKDLAFFTICLFAGFGVGWLIDVAGSLWTDRRETSELIERRAEERYQVSEKERVLEYKLCVINGRRYMMRSDGKVWEEYGSGWILMHNPPKRLVQRLKSADNNVY